MTVQQVSSKRFVTVSELADLCQLSRSRFYDLMEAGVFPKPVRHPSSKRPMYDQELQAKCLAIRQTGIGLNGQPVLFNRKAKKSGASKPQRRAAPNDAAMLDALKELGLNTRPQAVAEALAKLYPTGHAGLDQGDVVRKLFLHLQSGRK